MIKTKDLNSVKVIKEFIPEGNKFPICKTIITYTVKRYQNIENLKLVNSFLIECSQRVIVPNTNTFDPTVQRVNGYSSYPVLLNNSISISLPDGASSILEDYSPKTLNSAVVSSRNASQGTDSNSTSEHTTGSSTSQTNSFGTSVSVGFMGDVLSGGVSYDNDHSSTTGSSTSQSYGNSIGESSNRGSSDSFSIKDWASYAYSNAKNLNSINWVWAQEYPWDIIKYRYSNTNNNIIDLPLQIVDRLMNTSNGEALALSHLSLFGLDFTMKSAWIITPNQSAIDPVIDFEHTIRIMNASHSVSDNSLTAQLTEFPSPFNISPENGLNLYKLALGSINIGESTGGARVGFSNTNKFIVPPVEGAKFQIINNANNLMVSGTGFSEGMIAKLGIGSASFTIDFKVIDLESEISLFLKHWITQGDGCLLSIVINGNKDQALTKSVSSLEGQGGDNNLLEISLRNVDATSVDYHDFLQLGYNTIDITVTPNISAEECDYQLRAVAIV